MGVSEFWVVVDRIRAADGRYAADAYAFVMDGLDQTVSGLEERRHVSGQELLEGLCRFARTRFGMMSYDVLCVWGIRSGGDVGDIVFQLVDAGILARRDEDSREDFNTSLDLKQVLEDAYFDSSEAQDVGD